MSIDKIYLKCQKLFMTMKQPSFDDPKVQAILEAAFEAFLKFGFKRASMADIADSAGMSRAALYLHFKNKDDIFRGMIAAYYVEGLEALKAVLEQDLSAKVLIKESFAALTEARFPALLDSPHGAEFLDTKSVAFADAAKEGDEMIFRMFAEGLAQAAREGRITLSGLGGNAQDVAGVLLKAMLGLKAGAQSYDDFATQRDQLADLFGRALSA
jgi:AcrR family transcriptional regulator